jgi:hypothetical protein
MARDIVDRDLGLRALRRLMRRRRSDVDLVVGLRGNGPAGATHGGGGDGLTVVDVGVFNEFGTQTAPERSFLRSTFDENQREYAQLAGLAVRRAAGDAARGRSVTTGQRSLRRQLGRIGLKITGDVRAKIDSGVGPPNAPSTIAAKGSSGTLRDIGQLKQSVDFEVRLPGE